VTVKNSGIGKDYNVT